MILADKGYTLECFKKIFDNVNTQIWTLVDKRTYGYANKAHADFFDIKVLDIVNKDLRTFINTEEANICISNNTRVYEMKRELTTDEWVMCKNGHKNLLKITRTPILDDNNNVEMIVCMAEDISQQRYLEEQKRLKEEILYLMIEFTNELLTNTDYKNALYKGISKLGQATKVDRVYYWENHLDKSDNKWYTSQKYEWTNDGVEPELDNPVMQNVPFEDVWDFVDILSKSEHFNYHVRDIENDFTRDFLSAQDILSILVLPVIIEGNFIGFIGFDSTSHEKEWSDIEISLLHSFVLLYKKSVERHMLEERVLKVKNNFDNFINTIPDLLIVVDLNGNVIYANHSVYTRLEYTKEEIIGKSILDFYPSEIREGVIKIVKAMLNGERDYCSFPLVSKSGELIDVDTRTTRGVWNGEEVLFAVTKDVTDLKLSEEKFYKAFNNSGVSMFITSFKEGRFIEVNDTFIKTMGIEREKIIGQTSEDINLFRDPNERKRILERIEKNKIISGSEFNINGKGGSLVIGQFNIVPIYINKELCLLSSMIDMTEQKMILKELSKAKETSDLANSAKSEFLAHMSHEIRTPMNAVVSYSDLLFNTDLSLKQREYIRGIKSSGQMLMNMINDTLDWGKVESSGIELEEKAFYLDEVLENVLRQIQFKSNINQVDILIHRDENIPKVLGGDPLRLQQVLLNLLSNAVKFTEKGQIDISIRLKNMISETIELEFSISDTGIGIAKKDLDNIFEPFKQASNVRASNVTGTGLGLAIAKKIVNLMGGHIGVISNIDKGSTFYFNCYFAKKNQDELRTNTNPYIENLNIEINNNNKYESIKVLVVDDNEINQDVVRETLRRAGINVRVASSGHSAIEEISKDKYDLVLMDLRMPDMDGYQTTSKIRELYTLEDLPIIAVTASVSYEEKERAISSGFNDYLIKPIDKKKLLDLIKVETKIRRDKNEASEASEKVPEEIYNIKGINVKECLKHFDYNTTFLIKILRKFYANHKDSVNEIKQAYLSGDLNKAIRISHTIKGIGGEIRAHEVYQLANLLEDAINNNDFSEDLLESLDKELSILFNSIKDLKEPLNLQEGFNPTGKQELSIRPLLSELKKLLRESDMDSLELAERLYYLSEGTTVVDQAQKVKKHCELFNFEEALQVLEEMDGGLYVN